jgi:hypothetical protein
VEEESQKKGIDPKLIGVGAFLLVGGIIAFLVNGGMSSSSTEVATSDPSVSQMVDPGASSSGSSAPSMSAPAPSLGTGGGGGGAAPPPPVPLAFTTVTPPNPGQKTGTVGILIEANKAGQAAGFARFAKNQFSRNGKWGSWQICVFSDRAAADAFKAFQSQRKGRALSGNDFAQLSSSGVWQSTPAYLESTGNSEKIYSPSKNPYSWWPRR